MLAYKILVPIVLILVPALVIAWCLSSLFSLKLDFTQAFKPETSPVPDPDNGGVSLRLNGVDGDSAIIGFRFPNSQDGSEQLSVTEKNLEEIKSGLSRFEINRWEFLTNLPVEVFRFDIFLHSFPTSPNNAKGASYYLVTKPNGEVTKVLPGEKFQLARGAEVENLPNILAQTNIKLVYEHGLYQNFYDVDGFLVSQATGELIIKPTVLIQLLIIFGAWIFVVAFLTLLKQTILSSRDLQEVIDFLKINK